MRAILLASIGCIFFISANSQVGIGTTTPHSSAVLDVSSNNKGVLLPRMTFAQRNTIVNPSEGLMIYQTDSIAGTYIFQFGKWVTPMLQISPSTSIKSDTFNLIGTVQSFIVPPTVSKINVKIAGASGGGGSRAAIGSVGCGSPYVNTTNNFTGVAGKVFGGYINVSTGQTFYINVGGKGGDGLASAQIGSVFAGGYNGGGNSVLQHQGSISYCSSGFSSWTANYDQYFAPGAGGGGTYISTNNTAPINYLVSAAGGIGGLGGDSYFGGSAGGSDFSSSSAFVTDSGAINAGNGYVILSYELPNSFYTSNSSGGGAANSVVANATNSGLLSNTDWVTFNNKISGSGTASQIPIFSNSNTLGFVAGLNYNTTNNRLGVNTSIPSTTLDVTGNAKISSLAGIGDRLVGVNASGELIATNATLSGSDNLGNHTATQNIQLGGNYLSNDGSNKGLLINNNGYTAIGGAVNASARLNIVSENNGTGTANWIAAAAGGTAGNKVVMGTFNGVATIGAHTNALNNWSNLLLNPGGSVAISSLAGTGNRFVVADGNGVLLTQNIPEANNTTTGLLTNADWNTFNNKQNTLGNASTSVSGILTSTDWNTFNNKQNALPNANSTNNGILTATDWSTFNNKQSALPNATSTSNGILTASDWNTFNNKGTYSLPSLTSGSLLFSNGTTIAQNNSNLFWDNTNNRLGIGTTLPSNPLDVFGTGGMKVSTTNSGLGSTDWIATSIGGAAGDRVVTGILNGKATIAGHNYGLTGWSDLIMNPASNTTSNVGIGTNAPNRKLTVNSTNTGSTTDAVDWIATNVGGTGGDRVVSGILNGKATIGGHANNLSGWADLVINPLSTNGATVTIGAEANTPPVAQSNSTANAGITTTSNTKLVVNGAIRQNVYNAEVSIPANTAISITWTHNMGYAPIVMTSTEQSGGGFMDFVNVTMYNNNVNQLVFVLRNTNGSNTATGRLRWVQVW